MNKHELVRGLSNRLLTRCNYMICAADELPEVVMTTHPLYLIVNTHPRKLPGEHWVAMCLKEDAPSEFFDSFGRPPGYYSKHFENYLIRHGPRYMYNASRIQSLMSMTCGYYCLYYVLRHCNYGDSMYKIVNMFDMKNYMLNDVNVVHLVTS